VIKLQTVFLQDVHVAWNNLMSSNGREKRWTGMQSNSVQRLDCPDAPKDNLEMFHVSRASRTRPVTTNILEFLLSGL
jgi:hypothetical protein